MPALADAYCMIAIDRLGHGYSDKPHDPGQYEQHRIVDDIITVLDKEGVDRTAVWGFSLGAKDAASFAALAPDRVTALVYGSGPDLVVPEHNRVVPFEDITDLVALWDKFGLSNPYAASDALSINDLAALSACVAGTSMWWPTASEISAPSQWYVGGAETAMTSHEITFAAEHGIATHVVPGASHADAFLRTDDVLHFVRPFLDSFTKHLD